MANGRAREAAIDLLDRGFWPVAIYPPGIERDSAPVTKGKEPIGTAWGLNKITRSQIDDRFGRHHDARVGVALGPGRGPHGEDIADFEGDGPQAEGSYFKLVGGEVTTTMSWSSTRSPHRVHAVDHERLALLLARCQAKEGKNEKTGVFYLPEHFPDLEIRLGGRKKDGTPKQIQSVVPPSPGTDGSPREWLVGPETLAPLPEAAYAALEAIAEAIEERAAIVAEATGVKIVMAAEGTTEEAEAQSRRVAWFQRALEDEADAVARTVEPGRRNRLRNAAYNLGGQLHHGYLTEAMVIDALTTAARHCKLPEDEIRVTIADGIAAGKASPLDWPRNLDRPNGTKVKASPNAARAHHTIEVIASDVLGEELVTPEWYVKNLLVAGNPCVFGGPMKSLKTSILTDLVVSLATATRFLGHFEVPRRFRVGFLSGETGRYVIRQNAQQMFWTRELNLKDDKNIVWGFTLPQIGHDGHLKAVEKLITDNGLEALTIDPLYLTIDGSTIDVKSMFSLGPILDAFGKLCLGHNCLPIIAHHFVKSRENPYSPPEMTELAYGGVSQWMRQWCLVSRRESYDATSGIHKLHWRHGGSFGHAGELSLDIDTGIIRDDFTGRKWSVVVHSTPERVANEQAAKDADKQAREERADARKEEHVKKDMARVLDAFADEPNHQLTEGGIRRITGWASDRVKHTCYRLEKDGLIRQARCVVRIGNGATREIDGYERCF